VSPSRHYLAGGTVLPDLMELDVMRPETLIDINALGREYGRIEADASGLRLGGLVRMRRPNIRRSPRLPHAVRRAVDGGEPV